MNFSVPSLNWISREAFTCDFWHHKPFVSQTSAMWHGNMKSPSMRQIWVQQLMLGYENICMWEVELKPLLIYVLMEVKTLELISSLRQTKFNRPYSGWIISKLKYLKHFAISISHYYGLKITLYQYIRHNHLKIQ